jgi:hypothetical protein
VQGEVVLEYPNFPHYYNYRIDNSLQAPLNKSVHILRHRHCNFRPQEYLSMKQDHTPH